MENGLYSLAGKGFVILLTDIAKFFKLLYIGNPFIIFNIFTLYSHIKLAEFNSIYKLL